MQPILAFDLYGINHSNQSSTYSFLLLHLAPGALVHKSEREGACFELQRLLNARDAWNIVFVRG